MGRVIVLGSINVDLETTIDAYPQPGEKVVGHSLNRYAGGKGANQAVAARSQGVEVLMVGAVGDDDAGRASLNRLHPMGIKLYVERIPQVPTGHAIIFSDGRTNAIAVLPGANAKLGPRPLDPIRGLGAGDILLAQLETPVERVAQAARHAHERGARVIINAAPYAELPDDVIAMSDPLIIRHDDEAAFAARGVEPVALVVLRGKDGLDWDGRRFSGEVVADDEVIDTVGASDALIGTLAACLAKGADRPTAARRALQVAADNVRHAGAQRSSRL